MEKKKPTNAQLQRRIDNALIHIDKTKETQEIFFSDKGLRLIATNDYAIVETGYHRHVFSSFTASGVSRPWLYVRRFIEIANENDCKHEDGYSYTKLFEELKSNKKDDEYNIASYMDWWLFNIFTPLYSIGETSVEAFMVYEEYVHNISRNQVLLSEKTENMTNKQFMSAVIENMKIIVNELDESILFEKKTDEEIMQENIDAINEMETNSLIEQENESQN